VPLPLLSDDYPSTDGDADADVDVDAAELAALVETHLDDAAVVCPLCMRRLLQLAHGELSCACGLRLPLGPDAWTLPQVGHRLRAAAAAHSDQCTAVPRFQVGRLGPTLLHGLVLDCDVCAAVQLVL
jgi:hypothetical protein